MTGKQKIEAAFSPGGTANIPAVICHEGIFIRDHWAQLVPYPQEYMDTPDVDLQIAWRSEVIHKINQDWVRLYPFYSRKERARLKKQGTMQFKQPSIIPSTPETLAETPDEIDMQIGVLDDAITDGEDDVARGLTNGGAADGLYTTGYTGSPLCRCYSLWGFEGMMTMIAEKPEIVEYACRRYLETSIGDVRIAAKIGAKGIWIDEYFTDIISPEAFKRLNIPYMDQLIAEIRALGLNSIYYFCGDPGGKLSHIMSIGADALAFEESKKGFHIDIEDIADAIGGRCTLLGNLDSIGILQNGTEEDLRSEISRQLAAGRKNKKRFIMSTGSPVTPSTPVERVRLYLDIARELGSK